MTTISRTRIDADLLIPGSGPPIAGGCVVLDNDVIAYAGPAADAPVTGDSTARLRVRTVMPGMWDCHCHFFGIVAADLVRLATDPLPLRAMRVGRDAERALMAGITSVREVGGLGVQLAAAVQQGFVRGPEIYAAGSLLSTTGGHGDIHTLPLPVVTTCERFHEIELCDGVPECLRAVRRQLRMGARVIKVCATGGVLSEFDHPEHAQFSHEELVAIVEEAARAERVVAAHCHGKAGIMAAIRAGVRTIEHGTYLDPESARAMADTGTILVPTRFLDAALLADPQSNGLPEYARVKLIECGKRGREGLAHAIDAGVTIAAGTDILTSGDMWGQNGKELAAMVACGLDPLKAIEAATANGPLTVGPQAAHTGRLAAGYVADVIAVDADPVADIAALGEADLVTHVWRAGDLVKSPTAAV